MRYQSIYSGELDEQVELYKETYTDDDMGGASSTWTKQDTKWAQVRALSGRERQQHDVLQVEGGYRVVIRNDPNLNINESWRIKWRGKYLNIRHIEDHGPRADFLVMEATKGVAT